MWLRLVAVLWRKNLQKQNVWRKWRKGMAKFRSGFIHFIFLMMPEMYCTEFIDHEINILFEFKSSMVAFLPSWYDFYLFNMNLFDYVWLGHLKQHHLRSIPKWFVQENVHPEVTLQNQRKSIGFICNPCWFVLFLVLNNLSPLYGLCISFMWNILIMFV